MSNQITLKRKPTAPTTTVQKAINTLTGKPNQSVFDQLPDSAFVREAQLVRKSSLPDSTAPLPFSAPTLWRRVKAGDFPKPIKLSNRVTAWHVGSVRAWMASQGATA